MAVTGEAVAEAITARAEQRVRQGHGKLRSRLREVFAECYGLEPTRSEIMAILQALGARWAGDLPTGPSSLVDRVAEALLADLGEKLEL